MRTSYKIIVIIAISSIVSGVLEALFPAYGSANYLIHGLFVACCLYVWCGFHAFENGILPPAGAKLFCGLIALVGVPAYFLRAFDLKTAGVKCLWALLVAVVILGLYEASFYAAQFLVVGV